MDDPVWSDLLPAHRADGDDQPVGQPRCVAALPLGGPLRLAVYEDETGRTYPVPCVDTDGGVRRARPGDGASEALVRLLASGDRSTGAFTVSAWHHEPASDERAITVDQTNESVVVGERAVVKWTVLADEGPHPGPSLLSELTASGFTGMPRPWGVLQWRPPGGAPARLVAMVVELVPGAVDGWSWVVDDLVKAVATDDDAAARTAGTAIGALTADFHLALARTARCATSEESEDLRLSALADLDRALAETTGPSRVVLEARADRVRAVLAAMPTDARAVTRVHGDLHIGQVLRAGSTYALTDFDGNPVVPAACRGTEQPTASDVASMAQSFTHAGIVVRKHHPALDPHRVDAAARAARSAFLTTYRDRLGDRAGLLDERLLPALALRQVCREFTYAATHLPRWSYVPDAALPMLLEERP